MHPKLIDSVLRNIESTVLYNYSSDEQYELDEDALGFLSYCTGRNTIEEVYRKSHVDIGAGTRLIDYLSSEGCLGDVEEPYAPERYIVRRAVRPSLRYLQLHITEKCNLNCAHCYLGEKNHSDMKLSTIARILEEFSHYGFKVLITGGEPLLHKNFWDVLKLASDLPMRVEVLTNGTLVTPEVALGLSKYADQVQISLDGMREGHEAIRGNGTFEATVEGMTNASEFMPVSCATMIHSKNLREFDSMESMLEDMGVCEWLLDIPSNAGNMTRHGELSLPYEDAVEIFRKHGYSTGVHMGDGSLSCGSHICSIRPNGNVSKCGFFNDSVGNVEDKSLEECWLKVVDEYIPPLKELNCRECSVLEKCRGGCRFRAASEDFYGKDPFMCSLYL
ncbi:MAG: radical SAM/SPASM domain-containing protein [Candidatus Hydrothermarchaeaceae archaeon]